MLTLNPKERITAAKALDHEWIVHKGGEHVESEHRHNIV